MPYIGADIKLARQFCDASDWSRDGTTGNPNEGITDDLLLSFANDAQDYLQGVILSTFPDEFTDSEVQNLAANVEEYTPVGNLYIGRKFITVRISRTGLTQDYRVIPQKTMLERDTQPGFPQFYIARSGKILIDPIYQGGTAKVEMNYYRELDNLSTRRGKITAANGTTSITVDVNEGTFDTYQLANADYICVNDRYGVVKAYNLQVASFTPGTGVILVTATTFSAVAGDYVTVGRYTTTHSKLSEHCHRYIRVYIQKRTLSKDSSVDAITESKELSDIEDEIKESYENISEDVMQPPIIDPLME